MFIKDNVFIEFDEESKELWIKNQMKTLIKMNKVNGQPMNNFYNNFERILRINISSVNDKFDFLK